MTVDLLQAIRWASMAWNDVLHFLETKGNMKPANELAKDIANVQSDWLTQGGGQLKLTDFLKTV